MLTRVMRLGLLLSLATVISACTNLKAVRDFTASSAQLTGYTEVTERYLGRTERTLAVVPSDKKFDQDRINLTAEGLRTEAIKDSLFKLHYVATGYMSALAQLAGEESFDLTPQIDKVTGALVAAPSLGINAKHVQAYGSIASKVISWALAAKQAKEVKTMVRDYGDSMNELLEAMELATKAMRIQLASEQGDFNRFHELEIAWFDDKNLVGGERPALPDAKGSTRVQYEKDMITLNERRRAQLSWAKRAYIPVAAEKKAVVDSADSAIKGIQVIRAGHNHMQKNIDRLTAADVKALLNKATADLKAVQTSLDQL